MEPQAEAAIMPISTAGKMISKNKGYAYLMLLIAVSSACLLASLAGALLYSREVRVEKEKELLFRGMAYAEAIKSYYNSSVSNKIFPTQLNYLLSDPRFLSKKYIRKLYSDPITGKPWVLVTDADGGIIGVSSSSKMKPLKQKGFPEQLKSFEGAQHYSDWIFLYNF